MICTKIESCNITVLAYIYQEGGIGLLFRLFIYFEGITVNEALGIESRFVWVYILFWDCFVCLLGVCYWFSFIHLTLTAYLLQFLHHTVLAQTINIPNRTRSTRTIL